MPLGYVPPLATEWVLPPVASGSISCMPLSSPWAPLSSYT